MATRAYMPPVMSPATARSTQRPRLLPGGLREDHGRGRARGGPHHLEFALLPLAHDARSRNVLAVLEADLADDRVELVARDVLAHGLSVEPDLLHRLLEDLQARPRVRARPAVRLLLELRHVRVEVRLGGGAGARVPGSQARDTFHGLAHALLVDGEGAAYRRVEHLGVEPDLLGLAGDEEGVGRIGDAEERVRVLGLEVAQHGGEVLDAERVALLLDDLDVFRL